MDTATLGELQAPLKTKYRDKPSAALVTLRAQGSLDTDGIACRVETSRALVEAGLHPATGGNGLQACSGDMLLEALVACAGVTLRAVATALEFRLNRGTVEAEGDLDFRGTLGVDRSAPVGLRAIRLTFALDTDEPQDRIDSLLKLTERYCVVLQTLRTPPKIEASVSVGPRTPEAAHGMGAGKPLAGTARHHRRSPDEGPASRRPPETAA
jgi:uncharacterized OsmC-like protein